MRAAVVRSFGAPECIKVLTSQEIPRISEANQILVRVAASGVNPVDTYIRSGQYGVLPSLPYTAGRDGAGTVEQINSIKEHIFVNCGIQYFPVGSAVNDLKKGDRVWFLADVTGSAAEYSLTTIAYPLPEGISFAQGAGIPIPYLTASRALFIRGNIQKGGKVLVHGASGAVGLAACQLAAWKGTTVVGTAGTQMGCENVTKNGATKVYNHREAGYVEKIKKDYPEGFDLIVEMAAHVNLGTDLGLLGKNGRVAIVGNRGEVTINPRLLMTMESSVFGVALAHSTEKEYSDMAADVVEMFQKTPYRPIVHQEYSLEQLPQAHVDVMSNAGAMGNLVVIVQTG